MKYHVYEIVTVTDDVIYTILDEDDFFIVVSASSRLSKLKDRNIFTKLMSKAGATAMTLDDDKSVECINMNVTLEEAIKIIEFNRLING